ncbi:hypothetical protein GCM10009554_77950 [Kribbella koreensis]|uniref:Secreted protein n=2 Tax=Kribbella TaxID=182639 RepID=A0ABP6XEY7_9ACTN
MPFASAFAFGTVTGLAAGFSGVGVNSHRTVGRWCPAGTADAAFAVVDVRVAAARPATTSKLSLRNMVANLVLT